MKKLLLLVVMCFVGMMVPQDVFAAAEVSVVDGVVTITTTKAGDLKTYLQGASDAQKAAIRNASTIVFDGKFNDEDLKALKDADCCTQSTVDMSEAKFVKKVGGAEKNYKLYHSTPFTNDNHNDKCLVGGTLWQSQEEVMWVEQQEGPHNNHYENSDGWTVDNINTEHAGDHNVNAYVRIATAANYYRLDYDNKWVADDANNEAHTVAADYMNGNGSGNERVKVPLTYKYFQLRDNNGSKTWIEVEQGENEFVYETEDVNYQNNGNIIDKYNIGDYVAFPSTYSYFRWQEGKKWTSITEDDVPSYATVHTPDWQEGDRNNHYNDFGNPPQYIRFVTSWAIYKKVKTGNIIWNQIQYNDGDNKKVDYQFSSEDNMTPAAKKDEFAYVGGEEYRYVNDEWTTNFTVPEEYDYKQMSFMNWGANVTTAITSKYVDPSTALDDKLCNDCTNLTDLTISSGTIHKIANGNNKPPLENVTIGNKVAQIGNHNADGGFANYTTIKTVKFEKGGTDALVITSSCFIGCSNLTEVEIPVRTTLIETMAFGRTGLTKVTFEPATEPAAPLVIKSQAFEESTSIRDVYVFVDPDLKALVCEYNAFNFNTMDGQTNPANYDNMATLHFNNTDKEKEFYKGAWKEGFGFTQTELLAIRGESNHTSEVIENIPIGIGNNADLVDNQNKPKEHEGNQYNGYPIGYLTNKPANGWQQFAKTGNEIPVTGDFLRSYSTATPYKMPTYGTSGQPIVKIYRIWKFDDGYTQGADLLTTTPQTKAYAREVKGYIPDHTGLIMVGITESSVLYYFQKYTGNVVQYPFTEDVQGDAESSNLLVPSNDETVIIGPTDKSGNEIIYRNFGFKVYDLETRSETTNSTKTGKFLRAKNNTKITPNHSFLKLYKDFYHWKNEQGGVSNYDAQIYEEVIGNSKISFIYFLYEEEEFGGGIATIIRKAIEDADMEDGEFYTLQGVKVNKPITKGVYIHNGKKVLVK
ncbi:MAG: leucine-rich repeat protein [Prevotella sp.]|nr:leucine-rich repeat protein [Prevotella sp.]